MLENGKEYALEGFSEVFGEGGTYEVSKEFNSAPEGFWNMQNQFGRFIPARFYK